MNTTAQDAPETGQEVDATEQFAVDLAKLLVSDSLQFLRGQVQTLQAIAGLLLTAYVALLVAVWKQENIDLSVGSVVASFGPIALFVAALAVMLAKSVLYDGTDLHVGDLNKTLAAYKTALDARRSQLRVPGVLVGLGILVGAASLGYLLGRG